MPSLLTEEILFGTRENLVYELLLVTDISYQCITTAIRILLTGLFQHSFIYEKTRR